MCGEYADMAIESSLNDYIDSQFNIRSNSCFDDDSDIEPCGRVIQSPFTLDAHKTSLIMQDIEFLLRTFNVSLNMVVKCVKVTERAILFQGIDEGYPKLINKLFWIPKSIIHIKKDDFPQSKTYYVPNWTKINLIK